MLKMRSSTITKISKPPPPVPPRPSKTIVAEALAKRRKNTEEFISAPIRSAPPPPINMTKSQIDISQNVSNETSVSMFKDLKSNSRTIVFQSSNMKTVNNHLDKKDLEKDTTNEIITNQSFTRNGETTNKLTIKNESDAHNTVGMNEGMKNNLISGDDSLKEIVKIKQFEAPKSIEIDEITLIPQNIGVCQVPVTEYKSDHINNQSNFELTLCLEKNYEESDHNNTEKWDEMLKDKNHVNMLIDEMFASVLESSKDNEKNKQECNQVFKTEISTDMTTIKIKKCDKDYELTNNAETSKPTVLIIDSNVESNDTQSLKSKNSTEDLNSYSKSNSSTMEKKSVQFDDKRNAEFLIEELESMRINQENRKSFHEFDDNLLINGEYINNDERMKNCFINIVNLNASEKGTTLYYERLKKMSSLHGLPPLPKSLSGFNLNENYITPPTPIRTTSIRENPGIATGSHMVYSPHKGLNGTGDSAATSKGRKPTNLDTQLAVLKREMYSLRQLDLSLLSQLWSLNESIQDFRQILQEQEECRVLSPPSPSPVPSSGDEIDGEEQYYVNAPLPNKFRPAPPPPQSTGRSSNSSNTSGG